MRLPVPAIPSDAPSVFVKVVTESVDEYGYITAEEKSQSSQNDLDFASNIGYTRAAKEKTMSSVGVSFGRTINTGAYSSVRIDVSVQIPCENTDAAREKAFSDGLAFCQNKVGDVAVSVEDEMKKSDGNRAA